MTEGTDRIDLDALDVGKDEEADKQPHRGEWFWNEESGATDTTETAAEGSATDDEAGDATAPGTTDTDATNEFPKSPESDATADDKGRARVPHVPWKKKNQPVGIPVEGGGAGGTSVRAAAGRENNTEQGGSPGDAADEDAGPPAEDREDRTVGPGDSGSPASAMTMAFSYDAMKRFASPVLVMAKAEEWTDWIGLVGEVDAYVINKYVREKGLDIDFFNGAGDGPAERLAEITTDPNSMFSAERTVLVGTEGDREIADRADWEFVPLEEAADAAEWDLIEREGQSGR
jgi:hypothetical protein